MLGLDMSDSLGIKRKNGKFLTSTDEELVDINENAYDHLIGNETTREENITKKVDDLVSKQEMKNQLHQSVRDNKNIENVLNLDIDELEKSAKDIKTTKNVEDDEEWEEFLNMEIDDEEED